MNPLLIAAGSLGALYLILTKKVAMPSQAGLKPWIWPVRGPVTSKYGPRINPVTGAPQALHNGIDISAAVGTPVLAPQDGTVAKVWEDTTYGGGNSLVLTHANGWQTGYAHLQTWNVSSGDKVTQGQVVAYTGGAKGMAGAGLSTGAHLHLTVLGGGSSVDPLRVLP